MSDSEKPAVPTPTPTPTPTREDLDAALEAVVHGPTFGPPFFQGHLGELVKDQTPPGQVPCVRFHLAGGDVVEVLSVLGMTPRWVCLKVVDDDDKAGPSATRTEVVPFATIVRVTISSTPPGDASARIGFRQSPSGMEISRT